MKIILRKCSDYVMIKLSFIKDEKYWCFIIFANEIKPFCNSADKGEMLCAAPQRPGGCFTAWSSGDTQWRQSVTACGHQQGRERPVLGGRAWFGPPPGLASSLEPQMFGFIGHRFQRVLYSSIFLPANVHKSSKVTGLFFFSLSSVRLTNQIINLDRYFTAPT